MYLIVQSMPRFGGEDPLGDSPDEENWHHEGLTRSGAKSAGWSPRAENSLAFHADYVDSYLYNPAWWGDLLHGGGTDRLSVVMSSRAELVKLHFDDLFNSEDVPAVWRRYLSGTVAALVWLGHERSFSFPERVEMAQNVVGVSLHAIQDFYSHSNWIDDEERRSVTWFESSSRVREGLALWTGSYERPDHLGAHPHGDFLFSCTVFNNLGSLDRAVMDGICHAASPLSGTSLCRQYLDCRDAEQLAPPDARGLDLPDGVVWVKPGVNVDSRWQADVGVRERGLSISGAEGFEAAYELAARSSCQWLHILDHVMEEADLARWWSAVKSRGVPRTRYKSGTSAWEHFGKMPYRFITTGQYPPSPGTDDTKDWYVRLVVETSAGDYTGTDADIIPIVDGVRFPPLDHGVHPTPTPGDPRPRRSLLGLMSGHNDFESGDIAAYMLGPLSRPPRRITLLNDAPDAGDVVAAAIRGVSDTVVAVFGAVKDVFLGLIGYPADFVGDDNVVVSGPHLQALATGESRSFTLRCDGDSEGIYDVTGRVTPTGSAGVWSNGVEWRQYQVHFSRLFCVQESEWDRGTDSDEPFVLGLVIPHGGNQPIQKWRTGRFSDVDTGERRVINRDFTVRVPKRHGFISVACAVFESDGETADNRDYLLNAFEGRVSERLTDPEETFFETLAASQDAAWKLDALAASAFRRGEVVDVRTYRRARFMQWVEGGERVRWNLVPGHAYEVAVPDTIECDCDFDCSGPDRPEVGSSFPVIEFKPFNPFEPRFDG